MSCASRTRPARQSAMREMSILGKLTSSFLHNKDLPVHSRDLYNILNISYIIHTFTTIL